RSYRSTSCYIHIPTNILDYKIKQMKISSAFLFIKIINYSKSLAEKSCTASFLLHKKPLNKRMFLLEHSFSKCFFKRSRIILTTFEVVTLLFNYTLVLVAVIGLCYNIFKNNKK
ncbi:MAG: hypothetical protein Q3988_06085, partial [Gemella sp.]|nr:hypothetical protein [Gemella sp.]